MPPPTIDAGNGRKRVLIPARKRRCGRSAVERSCSRKGGGGQRKLET
ncbi:hypothetical protein AALP_AA2G204900 [Arabis alpina]|uniref:Uncharacterized protein n=1 Tax=Arabis alpina TaxID=50452 RepID=A0A087HIU6_ARAAL|nr:hypothetical protein AALP_AA2G204900 [Arabis alpina]